MSRARLTPVSCLFALTASACGPELGESAATLASRCGEAEPTQLLSLAPNEIVPFDPHGVARHGTRWLVAIDQLDGTFGGELPRDGDVIDGRIVSIDECGQEPPRTLAEGPDRIFPPHEDLLPWLACSSVTEELFIFDPEGRQEPSTLGTVEGCLFRETPGAIWFQRHLDGRDSLIRIRANHGLGSYESSVVADDMRPGGSSFAAHDDHVWYVDDERRLIQLDGEPQVEASVLAQDVETVLVAADSRFLSWGSESDPFTPGLWTIYDRESGESLAVDVAGHSDVLVRHAGFSFVFEATRDETIYDYLVLRLPSDDGMAIESSTFEFAGKWSQIFDAGPADLVLVSADASQGIYRSSSDHVEPQKIYEGVFGAVGIDDGELWAWDYYDFHPGIERETHTRLVRIPLDGSEPETIIDEVYQPLGLDDGRWIAVRDSAPDGRGELRVIDLDAGIEQPIDRDVSVYFARHNGTANPLPGADIFPSDTTFVYSVDDGSARHGLWSASLAPAQ